jgi:ectoine hydroxylase-related dioxygenase (phytanoyl-CoA dioxygenase family)
MVLTRNLIEQYERDGFIVLKDYIDPVTIQALSSEADRLKNIAGPLVKDNPRLQLDFKGQRVQIRKIEPLVDLSKPFANLAKDRRLVAPMEELLGGPVALFEDKINYKLPGGSGFGMHQDYVYWGRFSPKLSTALVYLDEATLENGCLEVVPGRHREGTLPHRKVKAGMATDLCIPPEVLDPEDTIKVPGKPGTVFIFNCSVPHSSKPNFSQKQRRVIIYTYGPVADQTPYEYAEFPAQYQAWLKSKGGN